MKIGGQDDSEGIKKKKRELQLHHGLHKAIKFKQVFVFLYSVINAFSV